ncbi:MAG: methyltransferase domain-containing protein [Acetobacteraceae bacterium]|nr:methyltransferase domain-containing protein [Acetobacteraceae bacterium]
MARVPLENPARIVDLGCGAGNVSAILKRRFPAADVLGVDGSPAMIAKARSTAPDCRFEQADLGAWRPDASPDLIFSNAALHWLVGHGALFPGLVGLLAAGGCLAVQMPLMHAEPLRALQYEVAAQGPWAERLQGVGSAPAILTPGEYWDMLRPRVAALELWETIYLHPLRGEDAVTEWAAGSSLRPFLDALDDDHRTLFRRAYSEALRPHYPRRVDGTTLLPFRRLFLLARI